MLAQILSVLRQRRNLRAMHWSSTAVLCISHGAAIGAQCTSMTTSSAAVRLPVSRDRQMITHKEKTHLWNCVEEIGVLSQLKVPPLFWEIHSAFRFFGTSLIGPRQQRENTNSFLSQV